MKRTTRITGLVFVFDADSGPVGVLTEGARKLLSIRGCPLCEITHGLFGEKKTWKTCRDEIGVPIWYVHRDELAGELAAVASKDLPCVVARLEDGRHVLLLEREVVLRCRGDALDLKSRIYVQALFRQLDFAFLRVLPSVARLP